MIHLECKIGIFLNEIEYNASTIEGYNKKIWNGALINSNGPNNLKPPQATNASKKKIKHQQKQEIIRFRIWFNYIFGLFFEEADHEQYQTK